MAWLAGGNNRNDRMTMHHILLAILLDSLLIESSLRKMWHPETCLLLTSPFVLITKTV
jgi:hypothetical protein